MIASSGAVSQVSGERQVPWNGLGLYLSSRYLGSWRRLSEALRPADRALPRVAVRSATRGYPHPVRKPSRVQLDALVEQATVDCYNDDEQLTGL